MMNRPDPDNHDAGRNDAGRNDPAPEPPGADEVRPQEEPERIARRGFFTEGFRQLLRPIADVVEKRLERVELPDWDDEHSAEGGYERIYGGESYNAGDSRLLRPPGALPESEFLERCTCSGRCVEVCPVSAIRPVADEDPLYHDKPAIDPEVQACVVCEDLACMNACPTGALEVIPKEAIRMGVAEVDENVCVRSHGEDCQICVDKCPIGPAAIEIPYFDAPVEVKDGCVGCGVCQMYCPTDPRSIRVVDHEAGNPAA